MSYKLPLLDDDFDLRTLLKDVSQMRKLKASRNKFPTDVDWLNPLVARDVYADLAQAGVAYTQGALEPSREIAERLSHYGDRIVSTIPAWAEYFSVPMRILIAPSDAYFGFSMMSEPQHIYLGSIVEQLKHDELLLENYLHEFAHIWLYFIQEVGAFSAEQNKISYTLPSGTSGRTLTATIDAAFVASVLRRFYGMTADVARTSELTAYVAGCLLEIRNDDDLTPIGKLVCRRLASGVAAPVSEAVS